MKHIILLLIFSCVVVWCEAQTGAVTVKLSHDNQPIEHAAASLIRLPDSALYKTALSDHSGIALFEHVKPGRYLIRTAAVGFRTAYSDVIIVNDVIVNAGNVALSKQSNQLANVNVSVRKPFIQRLNDRMIVNVENSSVNAGSTAFEVLERSPSVNIDANDVISLRGREGVVIMIDGKLSPMSGSDLINMLRAMPAGSIESVHLITNPSAKYDAAGNAGIIDIRMKKDQRLGTNASVSLHYGQGKYLKSTDGFQFNYRSKKFNVFGNYNFNQRNTFMNLLQDRSFYNASGLSAKDFKDNYNTVENTTHTARMGADYFAGKKTILGVVFSGTLTDIASINSNTSSVEGINAPEYYFNTKATGDNSNKNGWVNFNIKHRLNDKGKEFSADADYARYSNNTLSLTNSYFFRKDGTTYRPDYILAGDQRGALTMRTVKADFVNPIAGKMRLEIGFKAAHISSDNDAKFFDMSSGSPVDDVQKTNHFLYDEKMVALYGLLNREVGKLNLQLGLRAEHTNIKTKQLKGDLVRDSGYLQFFPSAYLTYKVNANQTIGINVSRRIDRPGYAQLNPFLFLLDATAYSTGNPNLLPQNTWSFELNWTWKVFNIGLAYSQTQKVHNVTVARYRDVFPNSTADENVTVQIPVNLQRLNYYGLTIAAPVRINRVWNMVNNAVVYYRKFRGALGNSMLNAGRPTLSANVNNSFQLGKGWSAELNGQVMTGHQYGFLKMSTLGSVSAGISKSLWANKATLRLNATDIFYTNNPKATLTFSDYVETWKGTRDTRVVNLTFTYRFGKSTVAASRKRTTASEEERARANAN
jgi:iron complex outermembrane receptor protein